MKRVKGLLCLATALLVTGCSGSLTERYGQTVLEEVAPYAPTRESLVYCSDHGCAERYVLTLSPSDWQAIAAHFEQPPADAAEERRRLAAAAATFETIAGEYTDTSDDLAGTFAGFGSQGQLDCIDEAVNMTQLSRLLAAEGLLSFHTPGLPVQRGTLLDGWPHYAASLEERASGESYVFDSWYRDNGEQALVLPTETWRAGLGEELLACLDANDRSAVASEESAALCFGG